MHPSGVDEIFENLWGRVQMDISVICTMVSLRVIYSTSQLWFKLDIILDWSSTLELQYGYSPAINELRIWISTQVGPCIPLSVHYNLLFDVFKYLNLCLWTFNSYDGGVFLHFIC